MTLQQLRIFRQAVLSSFSLSKAAEALYTSQSGVTRPYCFKRKERSNDSNQTSKAEAYIADAFFMFVLTACTIDCNV